MIFVNIFQRSRPERTPLWGAIKAGSSEIVPQFDKTVIPRRRRRDLRPGESHKPAPYSIRGWARLVVRQAVRQAHGPEQSRRGIQENDELRHSLLGPG